MDNEFNNMVMLIDADNTQLKKMDDVVRELSTHGRIVVKRAYGNWSKESLKNWEEETKKLAIRAVQQFDYVKGKNATDIGLTIDALDLLHNNLYDAFILVSSDSDYTPLVIRMRESGVYVFGVGGKKTPKPFVNACDEFIYLENLGVMVSQKKRNAAAAAADDSDNSTQSQQSPKNKNTDRNSGKKQKDKGAQKGSSQKEGSQKETASKDSSTAVVAVASQNAQGSANIIVLREAKGQNQGQNSRDAQGQGQSGKDAQNQGQNGKKLSKSSRRRKNAAEKKNARRLLETAAEIAAKQLDGVSAEELTHELEEISAAHNQGHPADAQALAAQLLAAHGIITAPTAEGDSTEFGAAENGAAETAVLGQFTAEYTADRNAADAVGRYAAENAAAEASTSEDYTAESPEEEDYAAETPASQDTAESDQEELTAEYGGEGADETAEETASGGSEESASDGSGESTDEAAKEAAYEGGDEAADESADESASDNDEEDLEDEDDSEDEDENDMDEIHDLLHLASEKYADDEGYTNIRAAGSYIKRAKPDFDVRSYGYNRLTDLISAFPQRYRLKKSERQGRGSSIYYMCIDTEDDLDE